MSVALARENVGRDRNELYGSFIDETIASSCARRATLCPSPSGHRRAKRSTWSARRYRRVGHQARRRERLGIR